MAVAEQLYLGWGLLCLLLQSHIIKLILPLTAVITVIVFLIKTFSFIHYASTLHYISIYLLGAYCGILYYSRDRLYHFLQSLNKPLSLIFFYLGCLLILSGFRISFDIDIHLKRVLVLSAGFCLIILSLCYTKFPGKVIFTNKPVRYLGKISYGLYCYHAVVLVAITKFLTYSGITMPAIYIFLITLLFTIFVSALSYEYFEKRFIAKKALFI